MTLDPDHLPQDALHFLDTVFDRLSSAQCDIHDWSIDHLCYRTANYQDYAQGKRALTKIGTLLGESMVASRPIATFKLHKPLHHGNRIIDLIELPAPKPGKDCASGFEHLEVVLPIPFAQFIADNPNLDFDTNGLSKPLNQELKLNLDGLGIKFHHLSLESVIHLENNAPVHTALQTSQILQHLKPFKPLIAGTFPLNVHNDESDLDIIVHTNDLIEVRKTVQEAYGKRDDFCDHIIAVQGENSYIANFTWGGIPFEVFAQATPSVLGTAYRHFLIEERLLKVRGTPLVKQVRELRREQGLKAEPAFAEALSLNGDPYAALLKLADRSEADLNGVAYI